MNHERFEEPSAAELEALAGLLARADVWDEPPSGLEDSVVAAVARSATDDAVSFDARRRDDDADDAVEAGSSRAMPWWLTAAAVCAVVVAGVAVFARGSNPTVDGIVVALEGTDAAPGASAEVALAATPAGLKILLDADGLEPAPEGYFYEAWISNGLIRVSAGGFHLRNGDGPIELWAGVADPEFDTLAVTLEPVDGNTDSSGDVRLRGRYDLGLPTP
jgi:hypothetical protein